MDFPIGYKNCDKPMNSRKNRKKIAPTNDDVSVSDASSNPSSVLSDLNSDGGSEWYNAPIEDRHSSDDDPSTDGSENENQGQNQRQGPRHGPRQRGQGRMQGQTTISVPRGRGNGREFRRNQRRGPRQRGRGNGRGLRQNQGFGGSAGQVGQNRGVDGDNLQNNGAIGHIFGIN